MSGRQRLLAEIEAQRLASNPDHIADLPADGLSLEPDDNSYNPYDKPLLAKPLREDLGATARRRLLEKRKRRT